jgi:hypothetical protein
MFNKQKNALPVTVGHKYIAVFSVRAQNIVLIILREDCLPIPTRPHCYVRREKYSARYANLRFSMNDFKLTIFDCWV